MHRSAELALARRGAAHHGVFTRDEAREVGFNEKQIDDRLRSGLWIRLYPGVYTHAGSPRTWRSRLMAATLHARPACAAGLAAARLHGLPGFEEEKVEIVTWNHTSMPHSGTEVHKTNRLPRDQIVEIDRIPTTSIERTLLDLSGLVHRRRAAVALDHALHLGLTTVGSCDFCLFLTARRGRRGVATFRELVKARASLAAYPNSPLETLIFDLIHGSHLPDPSPQVELKHGDVVIARPDFLYPEWRVAVEGHSKLWHSGVELTERDRVRHERLTGLDYDIVYVTWADATSRREGTLSRIESALRKRGWRPEH